MNIIKISNYIYKMYRQSPPSSFPNCKCDVTPYLHINGVKSYYNISNKKNISEIQRAVNDGLNDELKNYKDVLLFMFVKQNYYQKIIDSDSKAATYKKDNKLFYFWFYDFKTLQKYRMNSNDIELSKNRIFTPAKLKEKIEKDIYDNRLVKSNRYNFFEKQEYFDQYLKDYPYYLFDSIDTFQGNVNIYKAFYKEYVEACFYSRIFNKINNLKDNAQNAKTTIFSITFPKYLFPNISTNERTLIYKTEYILNYYNLIREIYN